MAAQVAGCSAVVHRHRKMSVPADLLMIAGTLTYVEMRDCRSSAGCGDSGGSALVFGGGLALIGLAVGVVALGLEISTQDDAEPATAGPRPPPSSPGVPPPPPRSPAGTAAPRF